MKQTAGCEDITWWTYYNRLNLRSGIIKYIFHGWLAGSCSVWQFREDDPINQWANQSFPTQRVDLFMAFTGVGNSGIFNGLDFYKKKNVKLNLHDAAGGGVTVISQTDPKPPSLLQRYVEVIWFLSKQTWLSPHNFDPKFSGITEFSRSCLIHYRPGVVNSSMRHASCWFPMIITLPEHPSPPSCSVTYSQSHVRSPTPAWGTTNNREKHFPSSLVAHTWNLPAPGPADGRQACDVPQMSPVWWVLTCQKATNQLLPAPIKDCGGHVQSSQSSRTRAPSNAITAQPHLLSLQTFPTK